MVGHVGGLPQGGAAEGAVHWSGTWGMDEAGALRDLAAAASCSSEVLEE